MKRLRALLLLLAVLLSVSVHGQNFAQLTGVKIEPANNILRIRLQSDSPVTNMSYGGNYGLSLVRRMSFTLTGIQAGPDAVVEVGRYPVSHLQFDVPLTTGEPQLTCTLVLFKDACLTAFEGMSDLSAYAPSDVPQVMITLSSARTEVIITVISDTIEESANRPAPPPAPTQLSITGTAAHLTLHAVNADLNEVAGSLMKRTGVPISLDSDIKRLISAHFTDLTLDRILHAIATAQGLALFQQDGDYYLSASRANSPTAMRALDERIVPLRFIGPEFARSLLPDIALSHIFPQRDARVLVVHSPAAMAEKIEHDLRLLDAPPFQVQLRAWVVSTIHERDRLRKLLARVASGNSDVTIDSQGSVQVAVGPEVAADLLVQLQALTTSTDVGITTAPMMTVSNGTSASLFVGQDIYYLRQVSSSAQDFTLSSVKAGARLDISPTTGGEWITTYVRVDDNYVREMNALGPQIAKQSISSTVRLHSGDTMIIGGLYAKGNERVRDRTLPSWWPGGELFTRRMGTDSAREVWVLLQATASETPFMVEQPKK